MPAVETDAILVNAYGRPFTQKGSDNWFKKQCVKAGLAHCTPHGLRKSTARQLVEHADATQQQLKAAGGWSGDREVATYVADASQKKLALTALARLTDWDAAQEAANLGPSD